MLEQNTSLAAPLYFVKKKKERGPPPSIMVAECVVPVVKEPSYKKVSVHVL